MDFDKFTFEELDQHAMEKLVFEEDEMSPILKGHIFIEKILETLISKNMLNPNPFFRTRRSYILKLDIAFAMGLINEKYYSAFRAINNIRNNYAHKHNYVVTIEELSGLKFDWVNIQNQAFQSACIQGSGEAAKIATIFLCWKAIHLIKEPEA